MSKDKKVYEYVVLDNYTLTEDAYCDGSTNIADTLEEAIKLATENVSNIYQPAKRYIAKVLKVVSNGEPVPARDVTVEDY